MTSIALVVSGARERRALADALEMPAVTGSSPDDVLAAAREEIGSGGIDRAVVVAPAATEPARERAELEADLLEAGVDHVAWVDPRLGRGTDARPRLVAAAASAAAVVPNTAIPRPAEPAPDQVVVVDDPVLASDLATRFPVTHVTDASDGRRRRNVRTVRGRAKGLEDDGTGLRVIVDAEADPIDAEQVVWPEYDGPLADRSDVHRERSGILRSVLRVARLRAREPVAVERDRCAVGRKGTEGCRACAEVCPHDAVTVSTADNGAVTIDAGDCTDCGRCLGACPTEAIASPRASTLGELGEATAAAIDTASAGGSRLPLVGSDPDPVVIAFTARSVFPAVLAGTEDAPPTVPIPVADGGRVPAALLAATVAAGASGAVVVADPTESSDPDIEGARQILDELAGGAPVDAVATTDPGTVAGMLRTVDGAATLVDEPVTSRVREQTARALSVTTVRALSDGRTDRVSAPALGSITVDADACTLCESCDRLCPTGAIVQPDAETLTVDPALCVGCGLCTACPEDAIEVSNQVTIPLGNREPVVESDAVVCTECGEPFASEAGIDAVREGLDTSVELDLDRCPDCRRTPDIVGGSR